MICCKIITNFDSSGGNFSDVINELSKKGNLMWENRNLFFGNDEDNSVGKKTVEKIMRLCGYEDFFIDVYTKENPPHENDQAMRWITGMLVSIAYNSFEKKSQVVFRNIESGLDMLEEEIKGIKKTIGEKTTEEAEQKNGEEKSNSCHDAARGNDGTSGNSNEEGR